MHEEQVKRPLDDDELQAVVGGAGSGPAMEAALASGDMDTIMAIVQVERVALLESQLIDQVKHVQAHNDTASSLHEGVGGLQGLMGQFTDGQGNVDPGMTISLDQAREGFAGLDGFLERHGLGDLDRDQSGGISADELTTMIGAAQQQLDTTQQQQQMDMLRLQSLSNKRNEAFDMINQLQMKSKMAGS